MDAQHEPAGGDRRWQPTGEEMFAAIAAASARRRSDCPAFVQEFFEEYGDEGSWPTLQTTWHRLVAEFPWYAEDLLQCLDQTLSTAKPLPQVVVDFYEMSHDVEAEAVQQDASGRQSAARAWLAGVRREFGEIFDIRSS